jgi:hypothetical protein
MHDTPKVLTFLFVFAALALFPFIYGAAAGGDGKAPEIKAPEGETECVESKEFMRAWHMDMLNEWRNEVVRVGNRSYKAQDGEAHEMSLTMTCMRCHENEEKFCGECHNYAGVEPYCWDCHVDPNKE